MKSFQNIASGNKTKNQKRKTPDIKSKSNFISPERVSGHLNRPVVSGTNLTL